MNEAFRDHWFWSLIVTVGLFALLIGLRAPSLVVLAGFSPLLISIIIVIQQRRAATAKPTPDDVEIRNRWRYRLDLFSALAAYGVVVGLILFLLNYGLGGR